MLHSENAELVAENKKRGSQFNKVSKAQGAYTRTTAKLLVKPSSKTVCRQIRNEWRGDAYYGRRVMDRDEKGGRLMGKRKKGDWRREICLRL